MSQNVPPATPGGPFEWDEQRERAARLLAEGELTETEIAKQLEVDRRTVYRWKQHPDFQARVAEIVQELGEPALRYAIGRRERRLRNLNDRLERMHQVIRDRAADPKMADVPGGKTGLMVRNVKAVKGRAVSLYAVDTGLLRELREHEKQAAIELGQWAEKRELSGPGGGPVPITFVEVAEPETPPAPPQAP